MTEQLTTRDHLARLCDCWSSVMSGMGHSPNETAEFEHASRCLIRQSLTEQEARDALSQCLDAWDALCGLKGWEIDHLAQVASARAHLTRQAA